VFAVFGGSRGDGRAALDQAQTMAMLFSAAGGFPWRDMEAIEKLGEKES